MVDVGPQPSMARSRRYRNLFAVVLRLSRPLWWAAVLLNEFLCVASSDLQGSLRGSAKSLERTCAGLGVPPRESNRYAFYLGLALARAAEGGRTACLEAILELEHPPVEAGTPDHAGLTALAHVASRGDAGPFGKLLPRSDVRCPAWTCCAPLALASIAGHLELSSKLLEAGAAIDAESPEGRTPLELASLEGHLPVVQHLLAQGAAVGHVTHEDRRTALHRAASRGHADVTAALAAAGADPVAADAWGRTAIDLAEQQDHAEVVALLRALPSPRTSLREQELEAELMIPRQEA